MKTVLFFYLNIYFPNYQSNQEVFMFISHYFLNKDTFFKQQYICYDFKTYKLLFDEKRDIEQYYL